MKRDFTACLSLLLPFLAAASSPLPGQQSAGGDKKEGSEFIRFVEEGKHAGHLDSAVVSYRRDDGARVHLVAALHVGDKGYYEKLSKLFEGYDALLYEMIKPKDLPVGNAPRSSSGVSSLQRWLKDTLKLEFQLDAIDYTRKNFIHADMDPETFLRLQKERGESIFTLILRAIENDMMRSSGSTQQINLFDLIRIFTSRDRAREMKLVLGRQFQDIEEQLAGFEGEKGSVILTERNKFALQVFRESLESGKKNIGIFYGGGHMKDMEARLLDEFGFKKTGAEWLVAWDIAEKPEPARAAPAENRKVERF